MVNYINLHEELDGAKLLRYNEEVKFETVKTNT